MAAPQSAVQGVPSDVEEVQVKQPEQQVSGVPSDVDEGAAVIPPPVIKSDNFVTRAKALPGQLLETSKERLNDPTTPENKIVAPTLHAIGLPASSQEAQAKLEDHKAHVVRDAVLNYPPVAAGRMLYDMAGNLIRGQQEGAKEAHEAVQNVKEGGPILPNLGKAAYGYLHQTLSGIPFIGGNIERGGEAVHEGDIPKAIGETGAAITQVAAPDAIHAAGELPRTGTPTYDRFANNYLKPLVGEPRTPTPEVPASPEVRQAAPLARLKQYNVPSEAQSGEALGRIAAPTVETPDQEITPEVAAQSAADKGIKPVPLPASSIEGVPADVEGVPVAHAEPEKAIAKTEEPGKIIDQAKTAEPAEKLEEKTKGRAEEVAEKYPVPAVGLTKDPFAAPEEVKAAEPKPETGGTAEGAKKDTDLFAQAKAELGEGASIRDVAKLAQDLKDGKPLPEKATTGTVKPEFRTATTEEYAKDNSSNKQAASLTSADQMKPGTKFYTNGEGVSYAISPEGDLQGVVNNSGKKGGLAAAVPDAISKGAKTLDAWDLYLPKQYEKYGFERTTKSPYDVSAYGEPPQDLKDAWKEQGWKEGDKYPDVQYMKLKEEGNPIAKGADEFNKQNGKSPINVGGKGEPPTEEKAKTETSKELTDTDQRGLEKRLGAEAAADTSYEGREKQQRLLKGTMQQYADFANEQGPEKPGGGEWEASDFSKKGTGKKEVPANKKLVIDHAMKNVPHDDFMDATSEWGPPNLEEEEKTTKNASGESSASKEAINRTASEKSQGLKRVVVDTRSGQERPLIGVDAVDYSPQPYESVEFRGGDRDGEVIDSGKNARPYTRKSPLQKYGKSSGNPLDKYRQ